MKPYPEYKETGLAWLPKIPKHWECAKLRNLLSVVSIKNQPDKTLLSVVRERGVIQRNINSKEENHNYIPEDLRNYKLVKKGQFAMNKMKAWQGSYGISLFEGIVSPAYFVFELHSVSSCFFNIAIRSKAYIPFFGQASDGIRVGQWDLSLPRMREIPFFIPSSDEQAQIVRYLDAMTAKINKLIRAKKKQIALLQEQKQAIINQAVTKGLDPHAEMKDSGIDWLGQIPTHWTIKKFSKVASIKSNLVKPEDYYDYPQVSPDKIEKNTGKLRPVLSVRNAGIISNNHLFFEGQILYSKIRPFLNKVTIAPFDGLCSADMYPIETILETEYLKFFILSIWFLYQIKQSGDRVKMPKINQDEMAKLLIVVPPSHEQKDIVRSIYDRWSMIDVVLGSLEKGVLSLLEYKNSLIASVVTGQVDVRKIIVESIVPNDLFSEELDDLESDKIEEQFAVESEE